MHTTAAGTTKKSRTSRFARLAAGAAVSVAFLTIAAPAMAQEYPEPHDGSTDYSLASRPTLEAAGVDLSSATLGALCGIAVSGAGLGIAYGLQRRRDRSAQYPD